MKKILLSCCLSIPLLSGSAFCAEKNAEKPLDVASIATSSKQDSSLSQAWKSLNPKQLHLESGTALVVDRFGNEVYSKNADEQRPPASITKVMTAMVLLDAQLPMQELISISKEDRDPWKMTGSRLAFGATLTREQLLLLALMSSENRAASALARTYPGGKTAFVRAMNQKAKALGMTRTHFMDPAGLRPDNLTTARDLVRMVRAAKRYASIRKATTTQSALVHPFKKGGMIQYNNTNRLVKNNDWEIQLSKTGYISEAGHCLVMQTDITHESLTLVLLNSQGKLSPQGDSARIRKWIEGGIDG